MKIVYHRADFDGRASAAAILMKFPGAELIPYNYGDAFPWERIQPNEKVFMADISLQPFSLMVDLNSVCDLVWIDHHHTAISEYEKCGVTIDGLRRNGVAACILTWNHLSNSPVPTALRYLGEYDVWNHRDPKVVPFQYGLRMEEDTDPDSPIWRQVFFSNENSMWINKVVERGDLLFKYLKRGDEILMRSNSFETEFEGLRAIAVNTSGQGSQTFGETLKDYDIGIKFCRVGGGIWRVGLYSMQLSVDCGTLAKLYGGGGHSGAAGFSVEELPFKI